MSLDPALRARIESILSANPVVLFLKGTPDAPQCGFSAKTAAALDATGASYAHVNVLADAEIREGIKVYGDWPTIPQLYIGGELVGGCDIVTQMAASGTVTKRMYVKSRAPSHITPTPSARMNGTVIGPVVTPPESKAMHRKSLSVKAARANMTT